MKPSEMLREISRGFDPTTATLTALARVESMTLTELRREVGALGNPRRVQRLTKALDDLAQTGQIRAWLDRSRPGRPAMRLALVTPVTPQAV